MAEKQPWLRVPIQIGRPGYYNWGDPNMYANPLVDTEATVGPYLGYTPSDVSGGIRSLVGSADKAFRKAVTKNQKNTEDRATRVRAPFKLGPVPGTPDPLTVSRALDTPNMVRPAMVPVLPAQAQPKPLIDIDPYIYSTGAPNVVDPHRNDPPGFWHNLVAPWKELGGGAMTHVVEPYTHSLVDPNADPNAEPSVGDALNPGATGVPTGPAVPVPPEAAPAAAPAEPAAPGTPAPGYPIDPNILTAAGPSARAPVPEAPAEAPAAPAAQEDPTTLSPFPATGALKLEDYVKQMQTLFPDHDWSNNPKQALADANAKRDLERTSLLAQLSFASGIVSGAGESWKGLGAGMAAAAGTYDKGFQKYQNALQDSADRYQRSQEQAMTYDTARRQAALSLYTSTATQDAENQRAWWKALNDRKWDLTKLSVETQREGVKQQLETVNKQFAAAVDQLKPPSDPTLESTEERAAREAKLNRVMEAWRHATENPNEVILPQNFGIDATVANQ